MERRDIFMCMNSTSLQVGYLMLSNNLHKARESNRLPLGDEQAGDKDQRLENIGEMFV